MPFYNFNQNNSGGKFHIDVGQGITLEVIVEANDAREANQLAERVGIYFDGCNNERDCGCCGDRWYQVYDDQGTARPDYYGTPLTVEWENDRAFSGDAPGVIVHYKDGRMYAFGPFFVIKGEYYLIEEEP
jgi:hypothetical protein